MTAIPSTQRAVIDLTTSQSPPPVTKDLPNKKSSHDISKEFVKEARQDCSINQLIVE
jgi:hypothetical protein